MLEVKVNVQTNRITTAFQNLNKQQIAKATSVAINKTLLKGRTVARVAVKKAYNIPQKDLNSVNIIRSRPSFLQGSIYASTKPIPMDSFSPKFDVVSGGKVRGTQSVSKRGILSTRISKKKSQQLGVSIEVKKGERVSVPFAFMLPGSKPRVFARGEYLGGRGSYGFIRRNKRDENSNGNDSVKPLVSITVFGAVINDKVNKDIKRQVTTDYERN